MLKHYSEKMLQHTFELLHMYQLAIGRGRFQRVHVSAAMKLDPHIVEGRWYGEIKRTKKFGASYDWKTLLNARVQQQIEQHNRDATVVQTIIEWFQRGSVQTMDVLDLLAKDDVSAVGAKTVTSPAQSSEAQNEEEWMAIFLDDIFE